jgi:hypothetical protein
MWWTGHHCSQSLCTVSVTGTQAGKIVPWLHPNTALFLEINANANRHSMIRSGLCTCTNVMDNIHYFEVYAMCTNLHKSSYFSRLLTLMSKIHANCQTPFTTPTAPPPTFWDNKKPDCCPPTPLPHFMYFIIGTHWWGRDGWSRVWISMAHNLLCITHNLGIFLSEIHWHSQLTVIGASS